MPRLQHTVHFPILRFADLNHIIMAFEKFADHVLQANVVKYSDNSMSDSALFEVKIQAIEKR